MALATTPALAQNAPTLTSQQTTLLERLIVTSTRETKMVLDVPQNISVIDGETIEKHQVRDIQDLVRYEPGISVDRQTNITNPFGQLNSFNIRGVGSNRVQMLVDGGRIQERIIDGSRDLVDVWNMKAVELVRGPNSVLLGADALGGTVAFRTRDPEDLLYDMDKDWAVELKSAWDSYDNSFRTQATYAAGWNDLQFLASFGTMKAEEPKYPTARADGGIWGCTRPVDVLACNELNPQDTSAYNGLAKLIWTPNADHEVKLTGEFFNRHTETDQLFDLFATYGPLTTSTQYNNVSYDRILDMSRMRASIEHDWQVNQPWLDNVKWKLSYSPQSRDMFSVQERLYQSRTQITEQLRNYSETFLEGDVQLTSSFDLGPSRHTLIYGFDGDYTQTRYDGINSTYRSDTDVTTVTPNQGFSFPKVDTVRADLYIQDEIELWDGRLTITPGLRYATYSIDPTIDPAYPPPGYNGPPPAVRESEVLLKKLGGMLQVTDNFKLFANYGEGFKMPSSQQLFQSSNTIDFTTFDPVVIIPNPNLRPESVQSYEAGIIGEFDRGYFRLGGFYAEYKDFIRQLRETTIPNPVPGTTYITSDNLENVQIWGVEFSGEFEVMEGLFASAAVSWSQGIQQVTSADPVTVFDGAVPLTAVLGLRYEIPDHGLEFEVLGTFAAGRTESSTPDAFLPEGYAVFDAYAKWEPRKDVVLTAGVQNIFNTRYFPNTLTGITYPMDPLVAASGPPELQVGPGRTFKLGASVKF